MKLTKKDFEEVLNNAVIELLDGNPEEWDEMLLKNFDPVNGATKTTYKGGNRIYLSIAAAKAGYRDSRWYSVNQIEKMGKPMPDPSKAKFVNIYFPTGTHRERGFRKKLPDGTVEYRDNTYWGTKTYEIYNAEELGIEEDDYKDVVLKDIKTPIENKGYVVKTDDVFNISYDPATKTFTIPNYDEMDVNEKAYYNSELLAKYWRVEEEMPVQMKAFESFIYEIGALMVLKNNHHPVSEEEMDRKKKNAEYYAATIRNNPTLLNKALTQAQKLSAQFN